MDSLYNIYPGMSCVSFQKQASFQLSIASQPATDGKSKAFRKLLG